MAGCEIDHEARRRAGVLGCHKCGVVIQTIAAANRVRREVGKHDEYGPDGILRTVLRRSEISDAMKVIELARDDPFVQEWLESLHPR